MAHMSELLSISGSPREVKGPDTTVHSVAKLSQLVRGLHSEVNDLQATLHGRDVVQRAEISWHDTSLNVLADRINAAEARTNAAEAGIEMLATCFGDHASYNLDPGQDAE